MAKPRPKAAKGHKHAVEFQPGEIIQSTATQKKFELSSVIGAGGFGLIYKAKLVGGGSSDEYAVKIEPIDNGPLFNECHVLQRIARSEINVYIKKKKTTRPLGIPHLIANGIHNYQDGEYRFIVLPLFEVDLQKIFEENDRRFEESTVYGVAVRMLDVLEYLDSHGYVHCDLKAANILVRHGTKSTDEPSIYLIDYGLATRFMLGDNHTPYKPIKKNAHNGTLEYTSIDAHDGADPSRRGDLQILGFCLWEWLAGALPWKSCLKNKDSVKLKKMECLKDLSKVPTVTLQKYFKSIAKLEYDDQPDYNALKNIFLSYLKKHGSEKLYIPTTGNTAKKTKIRKIQNVSLKKTEPTKRRKFKNVSLKKTEPNKNRKMCNVSLKNTEPVKKTEKRKIQNVSFEKTEPEPKRQRKLKSAVVKKRITRQTASKLDSTLKHK